MSRGCGERKDGGLYVEVELSDKGMPVEYFMLDPAIEWKGKVPLRAPMLVDGSEEGIKHMVMGVGKAHYPTVPDYVEEGKYMGFSKRLPRNFDLTPLTAGESRLVLMHPRAIPQFEYELISYSTACLKRNMDEDHECIFNLWSLAMIHPTSEKRKLALDDNPRRLKLPCGREYAHMIPESPTEEEYVERELMDQFKPGLFISLPIHKFTYVNKKDDTVPGEIKQQLQDSGYTIKVAKE